MQVLKKIIGYITFQKGSAQDVPNTLNMRFMHGMNRISILVFLAALIFMIFRAFTR